MQVKGEIEVVLLSPSTWRAGADVSAAGPRHLGRPILKKARALLRSGDYTKVQVAQELQVSLHTLWRTLARQATS